MAHQIVGIDHVQLAAPEGSEEVARRFFADILGLLEIPKPENLRKRGGVWFRCGNQSLHIGIEAPFAPAKKAHPAFLVQNLDELHQRLLLHDVEVKADQSIPGVQRIFVNDPFGNRIELMELSGEER